jgi:hypothetical protein
MGEYLFPGPHVFIIVLDTLRMMKDEIKFIREYLTEFFDQDVVKYSIVLFTRADELEYNNTTLDQYIETDASGCLREVVKNCNDRYLSISNRWDPNGSRMKRFRKDLVNMINEIRFLNDNTHFQSTRSNRTFNEDIGLY